MSVKNVVILGSTGSIGINTLKVIERFPDRFRVVGLTAYNNFKLLERQIRRFKPACVAVGEHGISHLQKEAPGRRTKILNADRESDLQEIASLKAADIVVIGMRGSVALHPFLSAVRSGKTVAPANKEALVMAGDLIMAEARKNKAAIIPIDSEQSAIFQCLNGSERGELRRVYLTASGGALLNVPTAQFNRLTVQQILRHPRWRMGRKITVDSATLMNKGFEVIEARTLFDLKVNEIEVVIHPEAVIHSMVEFRDGSILAQMGITDMRLPIQYALTYPQRWRSGLKPVDFFQLKKMTFQKPNVRKFPALALAFEVAKKGGTLPSVLNAADEEAVDAFLNRNLPFLKIYDTVERLVRRHKNIERPGLKQILEADRWTREEAERILARQT